MSDANQPLLSIQHNELIVRSNLADKLQQAILGVCDVLTPEQMSTMLQVHTHLKIKAVFETDHEGCMDFIAAIPDTVDRAQMLGYYMHAFVNQSYENKVTGENRPYSYHLQAVHDSFVELFTGILTPEQMLLGRAACYLHDIIEDCRMTYNDVVKLFGKLIADVAFAVTNYRGKNRKERAPLQYYVEIAINIIADALKVSDRYANMKEGFEQGGCGMFTGYVKEHRDFMHLLYRDDLAEGFTRLDNAVKMWVSNLKLRETSKQLN